ncbi:MAG: PaaI family thioesterase [Sphingomonas sp.]
MTEIPPGFTPHFRKSPLTDAWEPLYSRRDDAGFAIGLVLTEAHLNGRGLAHGGLIAALADNAMGLACVFASGEGEGGAAGAVTVNLSIDYIASAKPGDWLSIAARPLRVGGTLAFAEAQALVGDTLIARATGVFRMIAKNG